MRKSYRGIIVFLPVTGIMLYVVLYVVAALLYPGGSQKDVYATSFSVVNNYWCDLLGDVAINKQVNSGRPYAMAAMIVLCFSLVVLWYFAASLSGSARARNTILMTGVLSFVTGTMLFTSYHDQVIHISSIFGTGSMALIFRELYRRKQYGLVVSGIICVVFGSANYYIWLSQNGTEMLPVLQKLTFILMLTWFALLNVAVVRKYRTDNA